MGCAKKHPEKAQREREFAHTHRPTYSCVIMAHRGMQHGPRHQIFIRLATPFAEKHPPRAGSPPVGCDRAPRPFAERGFSSAGCSPSPFTPSCASHALHCDSHIVLVVFVVCPTALCLTHTLSLAPAPLSVAGGRLPLRALLLSFWFIFALCCSVCARRAVFGCGGRYFSAPAALREILSCLCNKKSRVRHLHATSFFIYASRAACDALVLVTVRRSLSGWVCMDTPNNAQRYTIWQVELALFVA